MNDDELKLFQDSVRQIVQGRSGPELDDALADLGWSEALMAVPGAAVSALFGAQGAAGAVSASLHLVLAAGLGVEPLAGTPVLLPPLGHYGQPGAAHGSRLVVAGLLSATQAPAVLVPVRVNDKDILVTLPAEDLALRPVHGIDPAAGLVEVTADVPLGLGEPVPGDWAGAVALGQVAVAYELVGCGRAMLELARTHALDRVQFGRPISGFQAVRHRLAETLVALEAAEALLTAPDVSAQTASMARGLAGRAARTAARHCQQVLGGIGFTTEHRFHLLLRRSLVLDQLLGSSRLLTRELGAQLLVTRKLPSLTTL